MSTYMNYWDSLERNKISFNLQTPEVDTNSSPLEALWKKNFITMKSCKKNIIPPRTVENHIEDFMFSMGLPIHDYLVFKKGAFLDTVQEICISKTNDLPTPIIKELKQFATSTATGGYNYLLGVPLIFVESAFPISIAECIVHELSHAAMADPIPSIEFYNKKIYLGMRQGFMTFIGLDTGKALPEKKCLGAFFEEGFAHYMAVMFRKNLLSSKNNIEITKPQRFKLPFNSDPIFEQIPDYYVLTHQGYFCLEIAARAIELLTLTIPNFLDTMLQARFDVAAYNKMETSVNALEKGLWKKLMELEYTWDDLHKGFLLVSEACAKQKNSKII